MTKPKLSLISVRTAAKIANVSPRRIQQLARDKRIPGAQFIAGVWLVPAKFTVTQASRHRPGKIKFSK